jgi:hypothetical protein
MNRTVGIILTVVTALCCGCTALFSCIFGGVIAAGQPVEVNGTSEILPPALGIGLLCLTVILIIIPIAVGFFTFRQKPAQVNSPVQQDNSGPIPPAS